MTNWRGWVGSSHDAKLLHKIVSRSPGPVFEAQENLQANAGYIPRRGFAKAKSFWEIQGVTFPRTQFRGGTEIVVKGNRYRANMETGELVRLNR